MLKKPAGRPHQAAARIEQPAGAVPVVHPARLVPVRGRAPGHRRRHRARDRLRHALGLRLARRARSSCGKPPAGSRSRSGSRPTSTPARRCRARRCPPGSSKARSPRTAACTSKDGSWSAAEGKFEPRAKLPVYERQAFPEALVGEGAVEPLKAGTEEFKNEEVRVWSLDGEVLIASHQRQAAPDQPDGDRRPAQGRRDRRGQVQGPGHLVAGRRVLRRCQPRSADAGLHDQAAPRASPRKRRSCRT